MIDDQTIRKAKYLGLLAINDGMNKLLDDFTSEFSQLANVERDTLLLAALDQIVSCCIQFGDKVRSLSGPNPIPMGDDNDT